MKFKNRQEAGKALAKQLKEYKDDPSVLVLALPRGGVPVALEVARELNAKMDVFLVRKIGFPGHEEYAMGAVAEGGLVIWNGHYDISEDVKKSALAAEEKELQRRNDLYRRGRAEIRIKNKKIILVDDGLATGSTMIAAIKALRKKGASYIIATTPVAPYDVIAKLTVADKIICLQREKEFFGVGQFYENFAQLTDEEVERGLKEAENFGATPLVNLIRNNTTDFDEIIAQAKDKRFVLIGEASHGTKEFYHIRAELTKRLIVENGFNAVAVEADWPDAFRVNSYVKNFESIKDANDALSNFKRFPVWMWRNKEVSNFVEWLRSHNLSGAAPVGFYGLDLYSLHSSIEMVVNYLSKIDAKAAEIAKHRYGCFDVFNQNPQSYGHATALGLAPGCEDKVIAELKELQQKKFDLLSKGMKEEDFFSAEQNARLVQNAEKYYRAMFKGRPSSWNIRDAHMTDTIDALDAFLAPGKIIIWAHNSHLGDARATDMAQRGEVNIGSLMRERHEQETLIVGFTTYHGTVTAADEWDQPEHCKIINEALEESYETLFHEVGRDFVLNLNKNPELKKLLSKPMLERFIGVIYAKATERWSHYYFCKISEQYDFVIHLDRTTAIHPLDPSHHWVHAAKESLETYPTGL